MEICLNEMNKKWDQSVYGSWHNYQNELILMFLWGIQTPDLVSFLTPINDVKGKDYPWTVSPKIATLTCFRESNFMPLVSIYVLTGGWSISNSIISLQWCNSKMHQYMQSNTAIFYHKLHTGQIPMTRFTTVHHTTYISIKAHQVPIWNLSKGYRSIVS